jgi:sugar (pentulose or hexulose) kinase
MLLLGGVTRLRLLSQLKADCLNLPVVTPKLPEAAATGAALLAGLGAEVFPDIASACASVHAGRGVFTPDPARVAHYDRLYEIYAGLYDALRLTHHTINQLG